MKKILITLSLLYGIVFMGQPSHAQGPEFQPNSDATNQHTNNSSKGLDLSTLRQSFGLTQRELNDLILYIGKLDLETIIPELKVLTTDLNTLEAHSTLKALTHNDRSKWIATMNEVLDLLQLETEIYFIDGSHIEPASLENIMTNSLQTDHYLVRFYDKEHQAMLADMTISAEAFKQLAGLSNSPAL